MLDRLRELTQHDPYPEIPNLCVSSNELKLLLDVAEAATVYADTHKADAWDRLHDVVARLSKVEQDNENA